MTPRNERKRKRPSFEQKIRLAAGLPRVEPKKTPPKDKKEK